MTIVSSHDHIVILLPLVAVARSRWGSANSFGVSAEQYSLFLVTLTYLLVIC